MPEDVFAVVDYGEVGDGQGLIRGVYPTEEEAEERRDEVDDPFKWVEVQRTTYHG